MEHVVGKRPKVVLFPTKTVAPARAISEADFFIYTSTHGHARAGFYGKLKVVRKTDGKLLFPFDGAEQIGPFASKDEALHAAQRRGEAIVSADLRNPEL
ncbi:conserved hypothetical protein [Burkholderia sp. 8Y]|uniref:DUF6723 family protein n=1 Tax=Burkholderia sp. 8Y TaxID=2653133 RepID=UPI0012F2CD35|nr:DUF6723 family protein [Burkholderia sp. 8Y]VXC66328.1 conserved hypothetical protein [Burkholderia sp. 8Y]